jgi:thioesterase domain-containing protein
MTDSLSPVVILPGAGGGAPDLNLFREGPEDFTRFEIVGYPGWKRYVSNDFSAEDLIIDVVEDIVRRVPQGPIRIIGVSIGGHLGYGAAVRLQAMGREIAGFCAIDTIMIASSNPWPGWKSRALAHGLDLLRGWRLGELAHFLRTKFWRALVMLAGSRLSGLFRGFSSSGRPPSFLAIDPVFEKELSMRLLIQVVAQWNTSLHDRELAKLEAPAILLRTSLAARDDAAWKSRCPKIKILEIPGAHDKLFEPKNFASLREAFLAGTRDWRRDERSQKF